MPDSNPDNSPSNFSKMKFIRKSGWVTLCFVLTALIGSLLIINKPSYSWLNNLAVAQDSIDLVNLHTRAISGAIAIFVYWLLLILFVKRELMIRRYICDSTYFLGFIFTLLSLMCSFADFGNPSLFDDDYSQSTGEFKKMVSFAGAALMTTLVAIILRVIHRHLYHNEDPEDLGNTFEAYVSRAADTFVDASTKLSANTHEIDSNIGNLSKSIIKLTEGIEAATEDTFKTQKTVWDKYSGVLAEETQAFVTELREANTVSVKFRGKTIEKLELAFNGASDKLKEFSKNLDTAVPAHSLKSEIDKLMTGLSDLVRLLEENKKARQRNIFARLFYFILGGT